ncbi:MAG: RNA recognition motif domain-containing protein [Patescibacteria group bacterium]
MATKLFVGNLPFTFSEESLKELFSSVGNVLSANIIIDKMTGRSRGFGFVEMSTDDEAKNAIEKFNGYELEGRKIRVNEARPLRKRFRGGRRKR